MANLHSLIRIVVYLFAPVGMVFGGAGMTGLGFGNNWDWLGWTGAVIVLAGLVWGLWVYTMNGGISGIGD